MFSTHRVLVAHALQGVQKGTTLLSLQFNDDVSTLQLTLSRRPDDCTVIPQLKKIIRSGITFVSRNLR